MEQLKKHLLWDFKYHYRALRESKRLRSTYSEGLNKGALMQIRNTWKAIKFLGGE